LRLRAIALALRVGLAFAPLMARRPLPEGEALSQKSDFLCKTRFYIAGVRLDNRSVITVIMIRTQVSLSKEEYESAKAEAARLGVSLAEFLRRSLRHVLPADQSRPWMRYAGMIETGERDASQKIDETVYTQKK
jgi:hypothetical protein